MTSAIDSKSKKKTFFLVIGIIIVDFCTSQSLPSVSGTINEFINPFYSRNVLDLNPNILFDSIGNLLLLKTASSMDTLTVAQQNILFLYIDEIPL